MSIRIVPANENDLTEVYNMVKGLAAFVKCEHKVKTTVEDLKQDFKKHFDCIVAKQDNQVVGLALFYVSYSTWVGKSLYLDDLYVLPEYRGKKVGSKLLNAFFAKARDLGCRRVRWQVLESNHPARQFYEQCGASIENEFWNCDFDESQIAAFNLPIDKG